MNKKRLEIPEGPRSNTIDGKGGTVIIGRGVKAVPLTRAEKAQIKKESHENVMNLKARRRRRKELSDDETAKELKRHMAKSDVSTLDAFIDDTDTKELCRAVIKILADK